ncbi:MAG: hypothetical protein WHS83_14345 [Chloroflexus sp.]|uniref:hypothetical protein n=1 Tax=Chloroflexus sp. TaxID=1904827 RepID=UPI0030B2094B
MEYRGDDELTDAELTAAEAELRMLLARWGEPQMAVPPADLSARIVRQLSAPPPVRRSWYRWVLVLPVLFMLIGGWGLLVDSSGPAMLLGDPEVGLGRFVLAMILIAKPLWNLWLSAAWWLLPGLLLFLGVGWFWWRLIADTPLAEVH